MWSNITKITQNNTGMYTKESSQQTFKISNNNLDVRFEKAHQNHNNEILWTRKKNKMSHCEMVKMTKTDTYTVTYLGKVSLVIVKCSREH